MSIKVCNTKNLTVKSIDSTGSNRKDLDSGGANKVMKIVLSPYPRLISVNFDLINQLSGIGDDRDHFHVVWYYFQSLPLQKITHITNHHHHSRFSSLSLKVKLGVGLNSLYYFQRNNERKTPLETGGFELDSLFEQVIVVVFG